MSIDALSLRNFRGFRDAKIELKPLTVLLGPNSSGKSSFGHALSAMSHAHRAHVASNRPSLSPLNAREAQEWPVDLGTLDDLRTFGVQDRVYIGFHSSTGWTEFGFGLIGETEVRLSYLLHPFGDNVASIRVIEDGPALSLPQGATTIPIINVEVTTKEQAVPRLELVRVNEREWQFASRAVGVNFDGMVLSSAGIPGSTDLLISNTTQAALRLLLENSTYLRATRERPMRGYLRGKGERQKIGYSGEWTASILAENGADLSRFRMPPAIPRNVREAITLSREWPATTVSLHDSVQFWLRHLGLASRMHVGSDTRDADRLNARFTIEGSQESHDITEVGFAISQLLPVLTSGLVQPSDGVLVVDLPEAHLHPRPQAALADFFCSLALSEKRCVVETHSEMFFHRLRLRCEMNPELEEKVVVYFVDPPNRGTCQQPRKIGLSMEDELRWPVGFLQEAWELESEIQAVRAVRK